MKANELRIGNFVYPFDDINLVDSKTIFRDCVQVCVKDFENTEHLTPIPLTEEWLNRKPYKIKEWKGNGADYQPETSKTKQVYYLLFEDIYLVFETWSWRKSEEDEWIIDNNVFVDYYGSSITLRKKEVHILQNLVFVLTGEELELK